MTRTKTPKEKTRWLFRSSIYEIYARCFTMYGYQLEDVRQGFVEAIMEAYDEAVKRLEERKE